MLRLSTVLQMLYNPSMRRVLRIRRSSQIVLNVDVLNMKERIEKRYYTELSLEECNKIEQLNRNAFAKYVEQNINMCDVSITGVQLYDSLKEGASRSFCYMKTKTW